MEQAREVAPGGRFVRRWTNLTVSFDCTTYSATFLSDNYDNVTIGSVLRLKTDDSSVRTPAGRDATAPARQLLEYLGNQSSAPRLRLVFGHQEDTTSGEAWVDESGQLGRSDTLAAVGDRPGLFGFNGFALTNKPAVLANGIAAASSRSTSRPTTP